MRAQVHWSKVRGFLELTKIFREVAEEENRYPNFCEFLGFLQYPPSAYDWRKPTLAQDIQISRWASGLDDARCFRGIYEKSTWLSTEMALASKRERYPVRDGYGSSTPRG